MILEIIAAIALADTLIGNRIFPGKVKVLKYNRRNSFYVAKRQRILFFPIWMYVANYASAGRAWIGNWKKGWVFNFNNAVEQEEERAVEIARIFSNTTTYWADDNTTWVSTVDGSKEKHMALNAPKDEVSGPL